MISGIDSMWTAFPNGTTDVLLEPFPSGGSQAVAAFQHVDSGVYVAVLPFDPTGKPSATPYHRAQAAALQVTWPFRNETLGALALVVGTQAQHGSFDAFKAYIHASAKFDLVQPSPGAGQGGTLALDLPAPGQDEEGGGASRLQVHHTGLDSSFVMVDGQRVTPAGGMPEVTFEGNAVDFASFDSYGVVEGDPLLEQQWGVGNLTVKTASGGYRVRVDGTSGIASFYEEA